MSKLFEPLTLRSLTFKNRIFVSPMCQYSCKDGVANDWHFVHLGSRAVGGAALVMVEATGVTAAGRITLGDMGIWNDDQAQALGRIAKFMEGQGAVPGIQIAHAGRKASAQLPWEGGKPLAASAGAWQTLAPSAIPFTKDWHTPKAMTAEEIKICVEDFKKAAERALKVGFKVVELHFAHGYLLHEFLSPLSNQRNDEYGGPIENRMRFPLEVAKTVRSVWPEALPVFVRISATDWTEGGWTDDDSVVLAKKLKEIGIDLIDCSTGGNMADAKIPAGPGYQVRFAEKVKREAKIPTGAVGVITNAVQAEQIISTGLADVVSLAREELRDPYWPMHAAQELNADVKWPVQYERAKR
jgi:2,4-dienoyl-CoA reductase-like NADH-dependent reductase (Old Yellow Enzyme family)